MFTYTASGSISFSNCAGFCAPKAFIYLRWKQGDQAWIRHEALRGRLRSMLVKKISLTYKNYSQPGVVYFDLNNSVYNPDDLISNAEAISLATAFYQNRLAVAQAAINLLRCR